MVGILDLVFMIIIQKPQHGVDFWTIFDMIHMQLAVAYGLFAFAMLVFFIQATVTNENEIQGLKKDQMRNMGV